MKTRLHRRWIGLALASVLIWGVGSFTQSAVSSAPATGPEYGSINAEIVNSLACSSSKFIAITEREIIPGSAGPLLSEDALDQFLSSFSPRLTADAYDLNVPGSLPGLMRFDLTVSERHVATALVELVGKAWFVTKHLACVEVIEGSR